MIRINPFPGLRPFKPDEDYLFFGREGQSDELLHLLQQTRFVAVVGTSGSGKSSLVRAGLLPALYGGFMTNAGSNWRVANMRPGNDPIGKLARALDQPEVFGTNGGTEASGLIQATTMTETILHRSALGVVHVVEEAGLPANENLLLLVDQFEELFRFRDSFESPERSDDAAAFVKLLLEASRAENLSIYVVLTMRSDFLGDCAQFRDLPEAINEGQYLIPRMTRDQYRRTIEGPVAVGGAKITKRLVQRLLSDLGDSPDQLPILQHALMRTWDIWQDQHENNEPLDLPHYRKIGGMSHGLSEHADEVYDSLSDPRSKVIAEKMFKRLTGKGPDNRGIRLPTRLTELCAVAEATEDEVIAVVEAFRQPGRSFLMPPVGTPIEVIDIAHESLMRIWAKLRDWVEEESESVGMYRRLAEQAVLHKAGRAGLWRDPELQLALDWYKTQQPKPNEAWAKRYHPGLDTALYFLEESRAARDAERAEDEARRKSEFIRSLRFWIALIMFTLMAIAALFAFFQVQQITNAQNAALEAKEDAEIAQGEAEKAVTEAVNQKEIAFAASTHAAIKAAEANAARLTAEAAEATNDKLLDQLKSEKASSAAKSLLDTQRDLAWLLSMEAIRLDESNQEAFGVFLAGLQRSIRPAEIALSNEFQLDTTVFGHQDFIWSLAYNSDGGILASGSADDSIILWDANTGEVLQQLAGHDNDVLSVAFSPVDNLLASGSADNTVILWDLDSGEPRPLGTHTNWVNSVAFSPDGEMLASGSADDSFKLWDMDTQEEIGKGFRPPDNLGNVNSLDFSPDGNTLAVGYGEGIVVLWDIRDPKDPQQRPLEEVLEGTSILSVAYSPDGTLLAASGSDSKPIIALWDTVTGEGIAKLSGHKTRVFSVSFNESGTLLASSSSDTTIRVWDVARDSETFGQQVVEPLKGGIDWVLSVAFSPDGQTLASAGTQGRILLWKQPAFAGEQSPTTIGLDEYTLAFSQNEEELVSVSVDGEVMLWDVLTGKSQTTTLEEDPGKLNSTVLSQYGDRLAAQAEDGSILLWDSRTGERLTTLQGDDFNPPTQLSFFPNGRYLVSSGEAGILLWDIGTGISKNFLSEQIIKFDEKTILAVSPDNRTFAAVDPQSNDVILYDIASSDDFQEIFGDEVRVFSGHTEQVLSLALSPSGDSLASGSADGSIRIWNVSSGQERQLLRGHSDEVTSLAFTPDGNWLVSGSMDGTVILWDVTTGEQIGYQFDMHSSGVLKVIFSPDGKRMASADANKQVILWNTDVNSWKTEACEQAGRNLSLQEWEEYIPGEKYQPTCPMNPFESPTTTPTPGS